jgi:hypothetical protein
VHRASAQLPYHGRPLLHLFLARKVPLVLMLWGRCRGPVRLGRSHYGRLLGQVCR